MGILSITSHKYFANIIFKFRNSIEKELIENGFSLPSQYLVEDHFPQSLTQRPNFIAPKEFINSNNEIISQENLRQLFSDGTQPKWAKDLILSELKLLFLRTRHLDNSKKNLII